MPVYKLFKKFKPITIQPPDELVWMPEQTIEKLDTDARLTAVGYVLVKSQLALNGYAWPYSTEFHYHLYNTAWNDGSSTGFDEYGNEVIFPTGWSVIFDSTFPNGKKPLAIWVRDSWVDTPLGGGTITIPAHYETITPAPTIIQSPNKGWNASAISANSFIGDFVALFRIDSTNTGTVAGINLLSNALKSSGYADIPCGIKTAGNQYQIVESGVTKTAAASFSSSDKFTIRRIAGDVIYAKNGIDIYTSANFMATNARMVLDISLYEAEDAIYDPFMAVASNGLNATDFPWSPAYGGSGGAVIATPDTITDSNGNEVIIEPTAYTQVLSNSEIVVSWPIESENEIVINLSVESTNEITISRLLESEAVLVIGRTETVIAESELVVALTETVIAESVLVIDIPANQVVESESVFVIELADDLESVVVDIRQPEVPVYGAY